MPTHPATIATAVLVGPPAGSRLAGARLAVPRAAAWRGRAVPRSRQTAPGATGGVGGEPATGRTRHHGADPPSPEGGLDARPISDLSAIGDRPTDGRSRRVGQGAVPPGADADGGLLPATDPPPPPPRSVGSHPFVHGLPRIVPILADTGA